MRDWGTKISNITVFNMADCSGAENLVT